jgi:hypothetical protein
VRISIDRWPHINKRIDEDKRSHSGLQERSERQTSVTPD